MNDPSSEGWVRCQAGALQRLSARLRARRLLRMGLVVAGVLLAAVVGGATVWGGVQLSRPSPSVVPQQPHECQPTGCPVQEPVPPCCP